jgi:hypothetical protein
VNAWVCRLLQKEKNENFVMKNLRDGRALVLTDADNIPLCVCGARSVGALFLQWTSPRKLVSELFQPCWLHTVQVLLLFRCVFISSFKTQLQGKEMAILIVSLQMQMISKKAFNL